MLDGFESACVIFDIIVILLIFVCDELIAWMLLSVLQGTWVYLLLDRMGFSITCTLVTLELLTGIHGKGYRLH